MLGEFKGEGGGILRIERCGGPRPGDADGAGDPGGEDVGDLGVAVGRGQFVGVAVGVHKAAPATGRGMRGLVTDELCRDGLGCAENRYPAIWEVENIDHTSCLLPSSTPESAG